MVLLLGTQDVVRGVVGADDVVGGRVVSPALDQVVLDPLQGNLMSPVVRARDSLRKGELTHFDKFI